MYKLTDTNKKQHKRRYKRIKTQTFFTTGSLEEFKSEAPTATSNKENMDENKSVRSRKRSKRISGKRFEEISFSF